MKQEPVKRIVSKRVYVAAQRRRIYLASKGLFCCLITLFCASLVFYFAWRTWRICTHDTSAGWDNYAIPFFTLFCVACGIGTWHVGSHSKQIIKEVAETDPASLFVVTEDPISGSLLRASEEPLQAQQSVLLRAVSEKPETPQEQLLRVPGGQE